MEPGAVVAAGTRPLLPTQVDPALAAVHVNLTMFEATPTLTAPAAASRTVSRVIVPTASSAAAWRADGVPPEHVAICPLGIDSTDFFASPPDAIAGVREDAPDL